MALVLTGIFVAGAAAATYYFYYNQTAESAPAVSTAVSTDAAKKPETTNINTEAVRKPETVPAVAVEPKKSETVPAVSVVPKKPETSASKKPETEAIVKKPEAVDIKKSEAIAPKNPEIKQVVKQPEIVESKKSPLSVTITPEIRRKEDERFPLASIPKERSASISTTSADVFLTNSTQKSAESFLEFPGNYVPNTKSMSRIVASRPKTLKRRPSNWPLKNDISIAEPTNDNKPPPPTEASEGTKSDGDDSAPPVATPTKPRSFTKGSMILPAGFDPKVALRGLRGSTINKKT